MECKLYRLNSDINVINKDITLIDTIDIVLLEPTNVLSPYIRLKKINDVNNINYVFLTELNRYYFVQDKQVINNDIVQFKLNIDVLETYKNDIINSQMDIIESDSILNENKTNYENEEKETIIEYELENPFTETSNVLITVAKGTI